MILNLIESNARRIEQISAWVKLPVKEVKKIAMTRYRDNLLKYPSCMLCLKLGEK